MRSLPLLLCALALLAAACTGSQPRAGELIPPAERPAAPAVVGETLDGETLALADLEGPVIVNFWASWCGPCVEEAPELRNLADAYAAAGVSVVGVNVKDTQVNARRFESDLDIPFPSWSDPAAEIAAAFGGIGPSALPSTLVLDAEHRVAAQLFGAVTFGQVGGYLDPLLAEAGVDADLLPGAVTAAGEQG